MYYGYYWDENSNDWKGDIKQECSYDANGNDTLWVSYIWDSNINEWIEDGKCEDTYDANGNETLRVAYKWNNNINEWIEESKSESTYQDDGNQTSWALYEWDPITGDWIGKYKYENYTFDTIRNMTLSIRYVWDENTDNWIGATKYESTYDAEGNRTEYGPYKWSTAINDWVVIAETQKIENYYDADGNMTLEVSYFWDTNINDWIRYSKCEYTVDPNRKKTLEASFYWDKSTDMWFGEYKSEFSFDDYGNLIQRMRSGWNLNTNGCDYIEKMQWFYSKNGIPTVLLTLSLTYVNLEAAAGSTATFNITTNVDWTISGLDSWLAVKDTSGTGDAAITLTAEENGSTKSRADTLTISGIGIIDHTIIVTQDGAAVGMYNQYTDNINIFTNPTSGKITICGLQEAATANVYNMMGQLVIIKQITGDNNSLNVAELRSGNYILKLRVGDVIYVKQFTKE